MAQKKPTALRESDSCAMKGGEDGLCPCPLNDAMDALGSKWAVSIVVTIGNFRRLRFHEIGERLKGIGTKTLTRRLRELEKLGVIGREAFAEVPPRVEYFLTEEGRRLRDAAIPLLTWAASRGG